MQLQEIDAHVDAALTEHQTNPLDLCRTYLAARPVLQFASTLIGMFKPKWKTIITAFIDMMDKTCA